MRGYDRRRRSRRRGGATPLLAAGVALALPGAARADDDRLATGVNDEGRSALRAPAEPAEPAEGPRPAGTEATETVLPASIAVDRRIGRAIHRALRADPIIERGRIRVSVSKRIALLEGSIASGTQWRQVNRVMARVPEIEGFVNALTVGYELPSDAVESPWLTHRNPIAFNYAFSTHVTIDGREDGLPAPSLSDTDVADAIAFEIWLSPFVSLDDVTIDVRDGVAFLTGIVDSWDERSAATVNALEGGAARVANALRVRGGPDAFGPIPRGSTGHDSVAEPAEPSPASQSQEVGP